MANERRLRKQLKSILDNEHESIRRYVAQEALDYYSIASFFHDVLNYGCKSGTVSSLIYYNQTHAFFDRFYNDIEELRHDHEQSTGFQIVLSGDLKNTLAWFAFEETAYRVAQELSLDA